ncbi:helix-turn-helix transcriptional regulator [Bacillus sp. CH30_1T]|uniref:helix-turn-helix transcriptional regulator n=1 Tax=Bacillus sp. CH30_1T TaxID=2604836 RepID=UPI0011EFDBFE|nr:helix-turn-helix transcriptional regulator [Bacillus sp. CH30_1T]KAA0565353.1 helix-turn-helix transcriptional regulator [Bacillus sp. CH30_1T]
MAYKCRLKLILAELEMKHGEFADLVGIDKSTMSSIVNNKSLPSFDTLYDIVETIREINPEVRLSDIWSKE